MTERQRMDEDELQSDRIDAEQRGGRVDDLAAEVPTTPAVSMPTSEEDQTRLPRNEQRADADNFRALFWTALITVATVLLIVLLLALNWIF